MQLSVVNEFQIQHVIEMENKMSKKSWACIVKHKPHYPRRSYTYHSSPLKIMAMSVNVSHFRRYCLKKGLFFIFAKHFG